jgi:hypothetical protein
MQLPYCGTIEEDVLDSKHIAQQRAKWLGCSLGPTCLARPVVTLFAVSVAECKSKKCANRPSQTSSFSSNALAEISLSNDLQKEKQPVKVAL